MATVVTVHYPIPICQRTTLMFNGETVCNGKIDVVRCSQCADTFSNKLPTAILKSLSYLPQSLLSRLPLPTSAYLPASLNQGDLGELVRPFVIPGYVAARQQSLQAMSKYADRIIAVCHWLYQALLINGIPEEKLVLSRCGISYPTPAKLPRNRQPNQHLKVIFLGRWDVNKGIDVLVKSIKNLPPEIPIELVIHGIQQDEQYRQKTLQLIGDDPRIRVEKQLTREELNQTLPNYDILAVPSQWLETGPLVVLEAHALSLPVIGSNLGGIAELVKHGVDGWLVPAHDIQAWTKAFWLLATDANLLQQLRQGIKPVRTLGMQAEDLATLYAKLHQ